MMSAARRVPLIVILNLFGSPSEMPTASAYCR
jgi:hypothetical protein